MNKKRGKMGVERKKSISWRIVVLYFEKHFFFFSFNTLSQTFYLKPGA